MLCLSRKVGERIVINGNTIVEVLEITGSRIRLGIIAPNDVAVRRAETLNNEPLRIHIEELKVA